jgi:hypothetical protein
VDDWEAMGVIVGVGVVEDEGLISGGVGRGAFMTSLGNQSIFYQELDAASRIATSTHRLDAGCPHPHLRPKKSAFFVLKPSAR